MAVSRDDFSIAFRSALLQRGGAEKFSILSLIILAIFIFFLDVYGFTVVKKTRSIIKEKSNMYITSRIRFSSSTCFDMIESEDLERFIGNRKNNYQKWDYIR